MHAEYYKCCLQVSAHLELAVQTTKVPRQPILTTGKWRRKIFSALRSDWSALRASVKYLAPPSQNPVSAPVSWSCKCSCNWHCTLGMYSQCSTWMMRRERMAFGLIILLWFDWVSSGLVWIIFYCWMGRHNIIIQAAQSHSWVVVLPFCEHEVL